VLLVAKQRAPLTFGLASPALLVHIPIEADAPKAAMLESSLLYLVVLQALLLCQPVQCLQWATSSKKLSSEERGISD